MPVPHIRLLAVCERFDSLAVRYSAITSDGQPVHVRMLDPGRTVDEENRVRDGSRFSRDFGTANVPYVLGEVFDETIGWGVVTEEMPGVSLAQISVPIPDEVAALLLHEGARMLEAVYGLRDPETQELMMAALRALDPRCILVSNAGRVTFTNLDSLLVRWSRRRSDTRRAGAPILPVGTPEVRERLATSPATGVYLLGCRVAEALEGGGSLSDGVAPLSDGDLATHDADWVAHLGGLRRAPELCDLVAATLRSNPLERIRPTDLADAAVAFLRGRDEALRSWLVGLPSQPPTEATPYADTWLQLHPFEGAPVRLPAAVPAVAPPATPPVVSVRKARPPAVPAARQRWCIGGDLPDELADAPTRRASPRARVVAEVPPRLPEPALVVPVTTPVLPASVAPPIERPRPRVIPSPAPRPVRKAPPVPRQSDLILKLVPLAAVVMLTMFVSLAAVLLALAAQGV